MEMTYLLSIGSNLGDSLKNIKQALFEIKQNSIKIINISRIYTTTPVDYLNQNNFYNLSIIIKTTLLPKELLLTLQNIEKIMGRKKIIEKGPRNIDIDIIFWEKGFFESKELSIPHKSWEERLFVIIPSLEIVENCKKLFFIKEKLQKALDKGDFPLQEIWDFNEKTTIV
jgi:2-amino-4-hydroxy-6-hydroxymethyldihydropteridine diphosphokinase